MRGLALLLALISLLSGIASAIYWFRSSQVRSVPDWVCEPGTTEGSQGGQLSALLSASALTSNLNGPAAIWSGVCILTGSISNFIGFLH